MDTYTISSWAELSDLAQQFSTRNRVFRGVEDESYDLIPKIGRCGTRKKLDGTDLVYSPDAEGKCIARFKREARPHLMLEPRSELEWLCIAQHHGLPTRLLDWSASPLVAAFFAVKPTGIVRGERKDPAIYALPPPSVVESDLELSSSTEEVVAYFPHHVTARVTAQRGLFTWHRTPDGPYQPKALSKWVIPSRLCLGLKLSLNKAGINQASMFPDVDGIAGYVEWLYKWDLFDH
ncbi:MAG: FRG domain-containing protein [Nitrospira sp.]|nr:FRG domain-containing protein [Nitrospira sp.]